MQDSKHAGQEVCTACWALEPGSTPAVLCADITYPHACAWPHAPPPLLPPQVLRVVDEEGIQHNATVVGAHLLAGLRALQAKHDIVGDVRGKGLMLGLELVKDRTTKVGTGLGAGGFVGGWGGNGSGIQ